MRRRPSEGSCAGSSLVTGYLWRLFTNPGGIDDEFERVRVLVLLHQLEVDKPFGVRDGRAGFKPLSRGLKQGSCKLVFAVGDQAFHRLHELTFGDAQIVDQKSRPVGAGQMLESLQVGLPIPYILVVKAIDNVFAQDEIGLIDIRLVFEQTRRNQICLVYCAALLPAPYRTQDLFSKPYE